MNDTECENLIKSVKWTEPANLISLAILEFINVLVIGGNCLVIAAVYFSTKLRSVTNYLIVNLAVADLLVGLAVLPFSATWEVFKVWIFGDLWCRIWLALDVLMCTASILNLCAISLDRYIAVTRPVTYPTIMSTTKARLLIVAIWLLSFVICCPPLMNWKDPKPMVQPTYTRGNYTLFYAANASSSVHHTKYQQTEEVHQQQQQHHMLPSSSTGASATEATTLTSSESYNNSPYNPYDPSFAPIINDDTAFEAIASIAAATTTAAALATGAENGDDIQAIEYKGSPLPCPWKCELTNNRGYVLYSALGSFYIPMFVMLFFYWRIYRAAVRTTRAINQGFKTTKGSPRESGSNRVDATQLILRIHRGRPCNTPQRTPISVHSMSSTLSVNSNGGEEAYPLHHSTTISSTPKRAASMRVNRQRHEKVAIKVSFPSSENVLESNSVTSPPPYAVVSTTARSNKPPLSNGRRSSFKTSLFEIGETTFNLDNTTTSSNANISIAGSQRDIHVPASASASAAASAAASATATATTPFLKDKKRSKRSAKIQIKRFRMETKAAKTLAIIVGGFILCWLPFFTMYLIRAFCESCIQPTVFSVLFWLGYCNSAINPVIYALFSNEFRIAFKRIICRCVCTRSGFRASENFQMFAARAFMAPATFHKTISGCSDEGDGVDFS